MKKLAAFLLCLALLFSLSAAMAQTQYPDALNGTVFYFSSGAGAWYTELTVGKNGAFTADYHDTDMGDDGEDYPNGTEYIAYAEGRFGSGVRLNDTTVLLPIENLMPHYADNGCLIRDGVRYLTSAIPYGLENTAYLLLYLPDARTDTLPDEFLFWFHPAPTGDVLGYHGLYNESMHCGFSGLQ